jgi:hypothetical protein
MAIESLAALGFMAVFFVGLAWYVNNHRRLMAAYIFLCACLDRGGYRLVVPLRICPYEHQMLSA